MRVPDQIRLPILGGMDSLDWSGTGRDWDKGSYLVGAHVPGAAWTCSGCYTVAPTQLPWCSRCGSWDGYVLRVQRPVSPVQDTAVRSAAELARGTSSWLPLSGPVAEVFGPLPVGLWSMAIWGPPGAWKSTSALLLSEALCQASGPTLYLSLEEGHGATLAERLRRLEIRRDDLLVACQSDLGRVVETCREHNARTVVIDSLSYVPSLDAEDLSRLGREAGVAVVGILHATKTGQARGSLSVLHAVDVVVSLHEGDYAHEKNRFGALKKGRLPWST